MVFVSRPNRGTKMKYEKSILSKLIPGDSNITTRSCLRHIPIVGLIRFYKDTKRMLKKSKLDIPGSGHNCRCKVLPLEKHDKWLLYPDMLSDGSKA